MNKRYTQSLWVISILFVALLFMLSFYSRLATDDYYFIADVRDNGINGSVYSQYMAWCGRYSACYLVDIFYAAFGTDQTWYFIYPLASFILLIAGLYLLFSAIAFQFSFALTKTQQLLYSILFTCLLFFLSVDIGETWLWYCSLSSYLWSLIAFVWGLAFLFGDHKPVVSFSISSLSFLFLGGASEVYSAIFGLLMMVYLIFRYKQLGGFSHFIADKNIKKFLVQYFIFGIAFVLFLVAPGNYLRDELFPQHEVLNTFFITAKSIVKFGILYLPPRLAYILAFAAPFIVLGQGIRNKHSNWNIPFRSFFWKASILFVGVLLLFFLTVAFVMVETGPPRIWFMVSILLSTYLAAICFYAGYSNFLNEQKTKILSTGGIILAFIILGYTGINQFKIVRTYAKANDERVLYLKGLKETILQDTLILLKPLPPSGMLYSAEIKPDTTHFSNKELKMGYDLKFHVARNQ